MNIMDGIYKLANFVNENWAMICAIIVVGMAAYKKIQNFFKMSKEEQDAIVKEQIEIAKAQIKEVILRLVAEAEADYEEMLKAGSIKRAQVIDEIFAMYPVLSQVTNQEEVIAWIDEAIDDALVTLREIIKVNEEAEAAE